MGSSALASTPTERWQALQQLEAAFHQSDGNMFFTYNGHSYRSVGVNADGMLRVIDQTTGQSMTLDPVDVYSAGMAAAGTPIPAKPQSTSAGAKGLTAGQQLSMFNNIVGKVGMYSGLLNMAMQIKQVKDFLSRVPYLSGVLGYVSAGLSAISLFQGAQSFYKNGFSWGGLLTLGTSALGIATGVNTILGFSVLTNPAGWVIAGAAISASFAYAGINDLITHGFSIKGLITSALGFVGTAVFTNLAFTACAFSSPIGDRRT